jgi:hypothetical protein
MERAGRPMRQFYPPRSVLTTSTMMAISSQRESAPSSLNQGKALSSFKAQKAYARPIGPIDPIT